MSEYTTMVRYICEYESGLKSSVGFNSVDDVIANSWDKIFTTKAHIFDESYRQVICSKILKHFYMREIGLETSGLWKLKLNTRFEEMLPYYNKLYESELIKFNPLYDTDLNREYKKKNKGNVDNNTLFSETSNKNIDVNVSQSESGRSDTNNSLTSNASENYTKDNSNSFATNITENANENENVSFEGSKGVTGDKNTTENGSFNKTQNKTTNSEGWDMYSDTPQGGLDGVRSEKYLTNVRHTTNSGTENTVESGTDSKTVTENYSENETSESTTSKVNTKTDTTNKNENQILHEVGNKTDNKKDDFNENVVDSKNILGETRTTENFTDNQTTTNNQQIKNLEDYTEHLFGKNSGASFSQLINEFRATFLNIDLMFINEFNDLFMNIW